MDVISREELFEMARAPIGDRSIQPADNPSAHCGSPEAREAAKRAQKLWLPRGKGSPVSREAKEAERELKARNFDLEDAIAARGGERGHSGS